MTSSDSSFRRTRDGFSVCKKCGSVVADERVHRKWHQEISR